MRYNLMLAWHGLKRFPRSTILAVLTVAMGLAATMTTLALLHQLTADPLPGRSGHLYLAWVDTVRAKSGQSTSLNGVAINANHRIKLDDAKGLLHDHRAHWQAPMASTSVEMTGSGPNPRSKHDYVMATTSEVIPLFGIALRSGRGWTPGEDEQRARVVVIDSELAQSIYGTVDVLGRELKIGKGVFRIIGVSAVFAPQPHFYDLSAFAFSGTRRDRAFVPLSALLDAGGELSGNDGCDEDAPAKKTTLFGTDVAHCATLSYWVDLPSKAQVDEFRSYLQHYVEEQKSLAGFGKPARSDLIGVGAWLSRQNVVPDNARLNAWLAGSFLLLCMANVAGLLAGGVLRRGAEIGIRRALGAPRGPIFQQHVFEAALICLVGGLLALPLTLFGLWTLRLQDSGFTDLARLDPAMFGALFLLALGVGVLTGWLPAWRASRVEPGLQVKSA